MKKKVDDKQIAYIAAEHQANLIRLAAAWAAELRDRAKETDNTLLGSLADLLDVLGSAEYSEEAQRRFLEMQRQILIVRAKSFSAMLEFMTKQSEALAANEMKWARAVAKRMNARAASTVAGTGRVAAIVKYADVEDGQTLEESITAAAQEDR